MSPVFILKFRELPAKKSTTDMVKHRQIIRSFMNASRKIRVGKIVN